MKSRLACLIFAALLAASGALGRAAAPDPLGEEPFSTFLDRLHVFSTQPSERELKELDSLCLKLPIRDLKPGQVGAGHPQDRDAKLKCMLRFVAAMDALTLDYLPTAYIYDCIGPIPAGLPTPEQNNANIRVLNFQLRLQRTRKLWAGHYLPMFLSRDCRAEPAAPLQQIIVEELKDDPRGKDAIASLSQAAAR